MDLRDKTILILGGSGLVGAAVARRLLASRPRRVVLVALYEQEVRATAAELNPPVGGTDIQCEWGNVFLPDEAATCRWTDMLANPRLRGLVIDDLLGAFSEEILTRNRLFQLLQRYRPDAVVDCINTATAFAYQDVFTSARDLLADARAGSVTQETVERHIMTLTMPQLIRHVQIAVEAMRRCETKAYVKIGTSGTGGMGLNIPYTHSEERPSRTLLTKSAVAGAHSILLFLVARTPGAPTAIEIKPTAAIAWKRIAYGPVQRAGSEIRRFDCPEPLPLAQAFAPGACGWMPMDGAVESVFIDVGENGFFARDEFETVTSLGQMEFITPEEVADYVVMELEGRTTGKDIVAALDSATAGPTYNAGVLRAAALSRLDELERACGVRSVAFEMLGPPRLTKMLYEAFILSTVRDSIRALAESQPQQLAKELAILVAADAQLRSVIISIGLPIVVDGDVVYRGENVLLTMDGTDVEQIIARGWVDLRSTRCAVWIERGQHMLRQAEARAARADDSGSDVEWGAIAADDPISPPKFAKWVFRYEDDAERIKR